MGERDLERGRDLEDQDRLRCVGVMGCTITRAALAAQQKVVGREATVEEQRSEAAR